MTSVPTASSTVETPPDRPASDHAGAGSEVGRSGPQRHLDRLSALRLPPWAPAVATLAAWAIAIASWVSLYRRTAHGAKLGFDLLTTWQAEQVFVHGGAPYSVHAFLYPPSCLLIFSFLAPLDHGQLAQGGLAGGTVAIALLVMLGAVAIGRRAYGITAALTLFFLTYTQATRAGISLENVSIACALLLAAFYVLALRGHWVAAGAAIGLSLAIKPLLLVVLLVFILAKQWRGLASAIALPAALNLIAFAVVSDPGQVWSKLPSLLNRGGYIVNFNSAWVDVARTLGLPLGVTWLLRLVTVAAVLFGAWLAWRRMADARLRLVTLTSLLVIGSYLAGTLSEFHFMLALVPLFMTIVMAGSIMRTIPSVLGTLWIMGTAAVLPPSWLGVNRTANFSAYRAFGMSLVVITAVVVLLRRPEVAPAAAPEHVSDTTATDGHRQLGVTGSLSA